MPTVDPSADEVKTRLRAFTGRFLRGRTVGDDEDIFARGFVNSLFAMQLVLFVEKEFQVAIGSEDLELDNFRTIDAMARLVHRKTGGAA